MSLQQLNLAGGIFIEDHQGPTTRQQHRGTDEQAWIELDQSIPDSEEKWRDSRKYLFNDTPGMIALVSDVLDPLLKHTPDFKVDANRKIGMIQRIILLAAHEVIRTKAQHADSFYDYVKQLLGQRLKFPKKESLNKQARAVKKLIEEMDKLYNDKLRNRSFEAILLYAPLIPRYLEEYMKDTKRFTECFRKCKPLGENLTEIQDSLPFYIPFFVCYLLTHLDESEPFLLSYDTVCNDLKTSTYSTNKYREFVDAVKNKSIKFYNSTQKSSNRAAILNEAVPRSNTVYAEQHTLSVPSKPSSALRRRIISQSRHFDPIRSVTTQQLDLNLATKDYYESNNNTSLGQLENVSSPTLHISINHYMVLAAEEELLRKAEKAGESQTGKNVTAGFSDDFYTYDWNNDLHDAVADQMIKDLVDLNIMKKGKDIFRYKFSIYHASGGITTPSDIFQVVIPTVKPDRPSRIHITLQDTRVQVPLEWSLGSYLLLSEGTILSPTTPISYISIAMPLMSRASDS